MKTQTAAWVREFLFVMACLQKFHRLLEQLSEWDSSRKKTFKAFINTDSVPKTAATPSLRSVKSKRHC